MKRLFLLSIGLLFAATTQAALASDPTLRFEYNGVKADTVVNAPIGQATTLKLIVDNPAGHNVTSVRAKLNFDPSAMTGVMLSDSGSAFTLAAPNENKVDINAGTIQIGRSSVGGSLSGTSIEIAQITLTPQKSGARLDFANFSADGIGDTALYFTQGINNTQLLKAKPQSLQFGTATTNIPNMPDPTPVMTNNNTGWNLGSTLSRPAPIKLKTETDGTTTVIWQLSQDPNVRGYKFYYSTQSGKYIRAKDLGYNNIANLTNLPAGKRYYFAVQAYDNTGKTSDYSDEVSVVIGQPASASHPFSGDPRQMNSGSLATSAGNSFSANTTNYTTPSNTYQNAQQTTDSGPAEWLAIIAVLIGGVFTVTGIRRLKS